MTIRNRELYRLNMILGSALLFAFLFLGFVESVYFFSGILLSIAVMSKTTGVQFDNKSKSYRKYNHFCFWTTGSWKKIGTNKELVILIKHGVQTIAGDSFTELKRKGRFSELYLMESSHTRRVYIDASENHKSIQLLANQLSELLNIPISSYNPQK